MKIIRNTPEQLILRSVPWFMAALLSIFLLAVIGFGMQSFFEGDREGAFWGLLGIPAFLGIFLIAFIRRDEVILDRTRNLVEMHHSTFLGRKRVRHELQNLERAMVQAHYGSKGGKTHRVALVLSGGMDVGRHPVTPVYSGGRSAHRAMEAINIWLAMDVDSS
ncbi:hypothetical protein [Yoonia sp. 2307UL14-13]|uniref:hypothetical protein n=1 Tax=Yoonia sp. 2307UL14-13 TaxID=3126506 RepID=UPI0030A92601